MLFLRRAGWRSLALGLVASVVVLGGLAYTTSHGLMAPLTQQADPTSVPTPAVTPGFGKVKPIRPGQTIGEVTAIGQSPPSFTVHSVQDGSDVTYRVLDATVVYAPPDRPYSFSLLKVGDLIQVRGGGRCQAPGQVGTSTQMPEQPCDGKRQQLRQAGLADGLPVARLVIVRPAGEMTHRKGPGNGKHGVTAPVQPGLKKGASNGTGQ